MEVDEVEVGLLNQFSNMQTLDHDELVKQMVRLVGSSISQPAAQFYLEMNQWNVQAAVCSYFDLESANSSLPGMVFVRDVTIGEGESVPPSTKFVKTWRIQNPGPDGWPPGCVLRYTDGEVMSVMDRVSVETLLPYTSTDVSVDMESPATPGIYQSKWRMSTATGNFFGDVIWVIITVEQAGTLSITQQFSSFNQLGSPIGPPSQSNPFGPVSSPSRPDLLLPPGEGQPGFPAQQQQHSEVFLHQPLLHEPNAFTSLQPQQPAQDHHQQDQQDSQML